MKRIKKTKKALLTEKYVDEYISKNGYPPTYREIQKRFRLKSPSVAYHRARFCRDKMIKRL